MSVIVLTLVVAPALLALILAATVPVRSRWIVGVGAGLWALYWILVGGSEGGTAYALALGGSFFLSWTVGAVLGGLLRRVH